MLLLFVFILLPIFTHASIITVKNNIIDQDSERSSSSSLGNAVVNVQHFTQLIYEGSQVYVYSAKLNDEYEHQPLKWSFYYVPVLQPLKSSNTTEWTWSIKKEVRMKLTLGNNQVEDAARRAIANRFDAGIASNYSRFWIVAPLMIDSMTAFIVEGSGDPVEGISPFRLVHPNALAITFRYECSNESRTHEIVEKLIDGDYEIEVNFYFAGFKHVSSNIVSITGQHLKSVLSKTTADGGNSNAKYIHRTQANKFIGIYAANVKKLIYMEKPGVDISPLTSGLDEQFQSLFQQGISSATEIRLSTKSYNQVWHSSDLNPDRLTTELNKLFTLNDTATQKHNNTDVFFNVNSQSTSSSSKMSSFSGGGSFMGFGASGSHSGSRSEASTRNDDKTTHDILSASDIQHRIGQEGVEIEWTGEKFEPKSFRVFKLTDLTDKLQVAIISKHMFAEKQTGAISRRVSVLNSPIVVGATRSSIIFAGEIRLFAGLSSPPFNWLVCNGSVLARADYPKLFNVIGTLYGAGNEGQSHFRLPDLRGRVAMGVDREGVHAGDAAKHLGSVGGQATHILTVAQLPSHEHDRGQLATVHGGEHTHRIHDPSHMHTLPNGIVIGYGNQNGRYQLASGGNWVKHDSLIAHASTTGISVHNAGGHTHEVTGKTGTTGGGQNFSLLPPFQTFNYIIYAGD